MVTSRDEGTELQNNLLDSWFIGGWLVGGSGIFRANLKMLMFFESDIQNRKPKTPTNFR